MCEGKTTPPLTETKIPAIGKLWLRAYNAVPKLQVPGTSLNFTFTVVSAIFLMSIRLLASKCLVIFFGWPEDAADEAAGSVGGVVHSSLLCPGLVVAFLTHRYSPSEHLSQAPVWWQELVIALLQFCTGYMVYDAIFIVLTRIDVSVSYIPSFKPDDYLFLGHHLMTTTYMTQTRVYQAGHMSAMMCMLVGEASNPAMNSWFVISKAISLDCCNGPIMQILHKHIEMAFAAIYLLFRVVIGPIVCTHMSWDLLFSANARQNLPLPIRLFWNFMIWAVILGSYSWIVYTHELLMKHIGGLPLEEEQQEL